MTRIALILGLISASVIGQAPTTFSLPANPGAPRWINYSIAPATSRGSIFLAGGQNGYGLLPTCSFFGSSQQCGNSTVTSTETHDPNIYEWDGSTLSIIPSPAFAIKPERIAWDSSRNVLVLVALDSAQAHYITEWNGTSWSPPVSAETAGAFPLPWTPNLYISLAYDPVNARTLVSKVGPPAWYQTPICEWNGQAQVPISGATPSFFHRNQPGGATFHPLEGRFYKTTTTIGTIAFFDGNAFGTVLLPGIGQTLDQIHYDPNSGNLIVTAGRDVIEIRDGVPVLLATVPLPAGSLPTDLFRLGTLCNHPQTGELMIWGDERRRVTSLSCPSIIFPGASHICSASQPSWTNLVGYIINRSAQGQSNSADAGLFFQGSIGTNGGGPFSFSLASNRAYHIQWRGPPGMVCVLFLGPRNPNGTSGTCVGSIDIGFSPTLSDVLLVAHGATNPAFVLDTNGEATQVIPFPILPPGFEVAVQGLVLQPISSPCFGIATAALYLKFL